MNENTTQNFEADAQNIKQSSVSGIVEQSYIDYAMSVIQGRALPDVRDGLKPVQRRLLYKMNEMGVTHTKSHRKSSSIIGETMGDLHPHGDSAIYESLVNMAQDFSMRVPLVDGQGNFGSMDGDSAAAMRYTEARLSSFAEDILQDINYDTVDFTPNYDNRLKEPEVLPSSVPNILINGSSGIAVGMTTSIPPHNPNEVIDATIHRIKNPESTVEDLMEYISGPDFPTGGTIVGRSGIIDAYKTGKGKVRVRSEYTVNRDDNQIIVTEIPYNKNKSKIVEKIAEKSKEDISGILDVRDESDRNGVRIVIDTKSTENIDIIENKLIESVFERTLSMNHVAIVDNQPKKLSLTEILDHYIDHRRNVVRNRSEYKLQEAEERLHIVKGRQKALEDIHNIVESIQESESRTEAIKILQDQYEFTEEQAEHITRMQLSSLTSLEKEELNKEYDKLENKISTLRNILENEEALNQKIIDELQEMREKHDTERKTRIKEDRDSVDNEDLIPQKDIVVILTEDNYIKSVTTDTFEKQNRGGKGVYGIYDDDTTIQNVFNVNSHDNLLILTDNGDVHEIKGYQIPKASRQAKGTNIINLIDIETDESIIDILPKPERTDDRYLVITTKQGKIKRTELNEFENIWNPGLKAINIDSDDTLVNMNIAEENDDVFIATKHGKGIRFNIDEVRATGRSSYGVNGIELEENDEVVDSTITTDNDTKILFAREDGRSKLTEKDEFNIQSRYGKGVKVMRDNETNIIAAQSITQETESVLISNTNNHIINVKIDDISTFGRNANGVIVMQSNEEETIQSISIN